jgi:hypothetical protein
MNFKPNRKLGLVLTVSTTALTPLAGVAAAQSTQVKGVINSPSGATTQTAVDIQAGLAPTEKARSR